MHVSSKMRAWFSIYDLNSKTFRLALLHSPFKTWQRTEDAVWSFIVNRCRDLPWQTFIAFKQLYTQIELQCAGRLRDSSINRARLHGSLYVVVLFDDWPQLWCHMRDVIESIRWLWDTECMSRNEWERTMIAVAAAGDCLIDYIACYWCIGRKHESLRTEDEARVPTDDSPCINDRMLSISGSILLYCEF